MLHGRNSDFVEIKGEKGEKHSKYLEIVGTKKNGVSPLLKLQNLESVHLWNKEIQSRSIFGTKFDGVSPFLELKNPESVRNHSYKRKWIDSEFFVSRNGLTPPNLVPKVEGLRISWFQRWIDSRFFSSRTGLTPDFLFPELD